MARIRTIKPDFFTSEDIVSLPPLARLLYIALWCEADRDGRFTWKPRTFKMRYLPGDDCDIDAISAELVRSGLVVTYGDGLAFIPSFAKHQHVNPREAKSELPDPQIDASVTRAHASNLDVHVQVGKERKGKEGEDGAASPPSAEKEYFARGKAIGLSGGYLAKLLKAKKDDVALARATIEVASTKHNPAEYVGAVLKNASAGLSAAPVGNPATDKLSPDQTMEVFESSGNWSRFSWAPDISLMPKEILAKYGYSPDGRKLTGARG